MLTQYWMSDSALLWTWVFQMFISLLVKYSCFKGILHIFLEIGSFYNPPRVKQLSFYCFRIHSADFLIFTTISVTRQFLVSLTSILGKKNTCIYYGSQWDQKLSGYLYSSKYQKIGWMDSMWMDSNGPKCLTLRELNEPISKKKKRKKSGVSL